MSIPAAIIGASGYVGGELLRLVAGHPEFELRAAVSDSAAGHPIGALFGHLGSVLPQHRFVGHCGWLDSVEPGSKLALFSAAPHGASAAMLATTLQDCEARGIDVHIVDCSADFRFAAQSDWEAIYQLDHGAPQLLSQFLCAVPEHLAEITVPHVGHPGCFATAMTLATVPLIRSGLTEAEVFISGVTGSTGSGKTPVAGTHHPERNSNLYAYKPLAHRHAPEVESLVGLASGRSTRVRFVPHSGPFARGIHVTVQAKAASGVDEKTLREFYEDDYANTPFVHVVDGMPRLKSVVASNQCHIGLATDGDSVVVMAAIDNLMKGAAGGAVQWMNRLWRLPETTGLDAPAPGWT
jgi:N-acetyl-gamma-glutamyl-phosphate reductase common form